jgi:orotate phosphoribosyltransferase
MKSAEYIAGLLLDAEALKFSVEKPFKFASGISSPVYMDCRILISDVEKRRQITKALSSAIRDKEYDVFAGTASAGIPWAAWISEASGLPMVYVRSSSKDHGRAKTIEGALNPGERLILVEDLVSTGMSSLRAVESLRQEKASVEDVISIFEYSMPEAKEAFNSAGVKLFSLSNFKAAVDVAVGREYLTETEAEKALEWILDPRGWKIGAS